MVELSSLLGAPDIPEYGDAAGNSQIARIWLPLKLWFDPITIGGHWMVLGRTQLCFVREYFRSSNAILFYNRLPALKLRLSPGACRPRPFRAVTGTRRAQNSALILPAMLRSYRSNLMAISLDRSLCSAATATMCSPGTTTKPK
jgi:hypothetical protein